MPEEPMQPQPQPMQPITNPVLVDAMATFKVDLTNREHEKAFLEAAINAKYLLPAQIEQPAEPVAEGEQVPTRIAFQIMTNPQGNKFMPAFTDEIELRKNRKPGERFQVAVMSFMDLYHFLKSNEVITGIVINPFGSALCLIRQQVIAIGDNGGQVVMQSRQVMNGEKPAVDAQPVQRPDNALGAAVSTADAQQAAIRQAMAEMEAAKASQDEEDTDDTEVLTDDLLNALKNCLKKQKTVRKAYISKEKDNGEVYLLIALDTDDNADVEEIGNTVSESCADYSDLPFECVPVNSIRAKELVANEKPFYEKKRFGFF